MVKKNMSQQNHKIRMVQSYLLKQFYRSFVAIIIYKSRGCSTSEITKLKTLACVVQFVVQLVHGQDVESVGNNERK